MTIQYAESIMMWMNRRGATNVVATMLIFGIMITSIGVLYGQIAPTLLGYETSTTTTNQEFVFQSISNEVIGLSSSPTGSVSLVRIVSSQTIYDINSTTSLTVTVSENAGINPDITDTVAIGQFLATVNGSFQPSEPSYVNRVQDENTYLTNNTGESSWVLTSDYSYKEGQFSMYFRGFISAFQTPSGWKVTIVLIQISFIPSAFDGSPVAFPVEQEEWTLRLRKQPVINQTGVMTGPITITHSLDGQSGTPYTFPDISGSVEVEILTVPILFGI